MSNINLNINNFGPISNANIELRKLNIIAGINGSGKTTSSKLLYCFLTSISDEKDYLANLSINERFNSVVSSLDFDAEFDNDTSDILAALLDKFPKLTDKSYNDGLKEFIGPFKKIINDSQINNKEDYIRKLNNLESVLERSNSDYRKFFDVSNVLFKSEFRINDLKLEDVDVNFKGMYADCKFSYELDFNDSKWGFIINEGNSECFNIGNVIYADSPSIFDSDDLNDVLILKKQPHHLRFLSRLLNAPKNYEDVYDSLFNQKLDDLCDKIKNLIGGHIYFDDEKEEFRFKKADSSYSMKDTASGVKQLGIIQMLLSNRMLNENSFLIMDEPEVNLHPEWQVKFVQIIVAMIKELNISVFINSHSPQFIEAIEVYSGKYGLVDESRFYLSEETESGKFNFREIKRKNLNVLYDNLGNPYDEIDEIRIENAFNGIE